MAPRKWKRIAELNRLQELNDTQAANVERRAICLLIQQHENAAKAKATEHPADANLQNEEDSDDIGDAIAEEMEMQEWSVVVPASEQFLIDYDSVILHSTFNEVYKGYKPRPLKECCRCWIPTAELVEKPDALLTKKKDSHVRQRKNRKSSCKSCIGCGHLQEDGEDTEEDEEMRGLARNRPRRSKEKSTAQMDEMLRGKEVEQEQPAEHQGDTEQPPPRSPPVGGFFERDSEREKMRRALLEKMKLKKNMQTPSMARPRSPSPLDPVIDVVNIDLPSENHFTHQLSPNLTPKRRRPPVERARRAQNEEPNPPKNRGRPRKYPLPQEPEESTQSATRRRMEGSNGYRVVQAVPKARRPTRLITAERVRRPLHPTTFFRGLDSVAESIFGHITDGNVDRQENGHEEGAGDILEAIEQEWEDGDEEEFEVVVEDAGSVEEFSITEDVERSVLTKERLDEWREQRLAVRQEKKEKVKRDGREEEEDLVIDVVGDDESPANLLQTTMPTSSSSERAVEEMTMKILAMGRQRDMKRESASREMAEKLENQRRDYAEKRERQSRETQRKRHERQFALHAGVGPLLEGTAAQDLPYILGGQRDLLDNDVTSHLFLTNEEELMLELNDSALAYSGFEFQNMMEVGVATGESIEEGSEKIPVPQMVDTKAGCPPNKQDSQFEEAEDFVAKNANEEGNDGELVSRAAADRESESQDYDMQCSVAAPELSHPPLDEQQEAGSAHLASVSAHPSTSALNIADQAALYAQMGPVPWTYFLSLPLSFESASQELPYTLDSQRGGGDTSRLPLLNEEDLVLGIDESALASSVWESKDMTAVGEAAGEPDKDGSEMPGLVCMEDSLDAQGSAHLASGSAHPSPSAYGNEHQSPPHPHLGPVPWAHFLSLTLPHETAAHGLPYALDLQFEEAENSNVNEEGDDEELVARAAAESESQDLDHTVAAPQLSHPPSKEKQEASGSAHPSTSMFDIAQLPPPYAQIDYAPVYIVEEYEEATPFYQAGGGSW